MIVEVVILASAEEIVKALMCRAISWRGYWLVPALAFAVIEVAFKLPVILAMPSDLVDLNVKMTVAFFAAVGTSIFHFYSSLLYIWTRKLLLSVVIGSAVHTTYNLAVKFDKAFYVLDFKSLVFGWGYTTACGLFLLAYFMWEKSFLKQGPA